MAKLLDILAHLFLTSQELQTTFSFPLDPSTVFSYQDQEQQCFSSLFASDCTNNRLIYLLYHKY